MPSRRWTSEEKVRIVLEGMKGEKTVAEICRECGLSQPQFYRWKNRFLEGAARGLGRAGDLRQVNMLRGEIDSLQRLVGKQAMEIETLKKIEKLMRE
jgi:transposase-like protein